MEVYETTVFSSPLSFLEWNWGSFTLRVFSHSINNNFLKRGNTLIEIALSIWEFYTVRQKETIKNESLRDFGFLETPYPIH